MTAGTNWEASPGDPSGSLASVENIGRCLGKRACGDAVGLLVERTEEQPSKTPSGKCPHGHQEAAFA